MAKVTREPQVAEIARGTAGDIVVFKPRMGVELLSSIEEACRQQSITQGVILSGVGALKRAVFRNVREFPDSFPVSPANRLYYEIEQPLELLSLTGWIAQKQDSSLLIHAHFSASTVMDGKVVAMGGHLSEGTITWIKVVVTLLSYTGLDSRVGFDPYTRSDELFLG